VTAPDAVPRAALDELADLVVTGWHLTIGYDRLVAGDVDVLGPGAEARAALNQALRRRYPGSPGLGGCWRAPEPGALEAFLDAVLHPRPREGPSGG